MHALHNFFIIFHNFHLNKNVGLLCICVQTLPIMLKSVHSIIDVHFWKILEVFEWQTSCLHIGFEKPWCQRHKLSWEHRYCPFQKQKRIWDLHYDIGNILYMLIAKQQSNLRAHDKASLRKALIGCPFWTWALLVWTDLNIVLAF